MRIVLGGRGSPIRPPINMFRMAGFLADADPNRPLPNWLTEADVATFAEVYRKSGFRGGLNWYRNIDRNRELPAPWQGAQIDQPALFIAGRSTTSSSVRSPGGVLTTRTACCRPAETPMWTGAGHWIQQERPDEVNAALLAFLKG